MGSDVLRTEFESLIEARKVLDIPYQYIPVLGLLVIRPGIIPSEMSEALEMSRDSTSRILKSLRLEYGAVAYEANQDDARNKHVYLTPHGKDQVVRWLIARKIKFTKQQIDEIVTLSPSKPRLVGVKVEKAR